jgi:hypothetical protein
LVEKLAVEVEGLHNLEEVEKFEYKSVALEGKLVAAKTEERLAEVVG